jgi:high-affinity K+ transport system ATPase subunit B
MFYLNSQRIPELAGLTFAQRMAVVRNAADSLSTPVKVALNIVKLVVLVPLFLLIARADGWMIVAYVVLLLLVYPLITRPLTFALCRKDFSRIRRQLYPS